MLKLMGQEIFTILRSKFCLSKPVDILYSDFQANQFHVSLFNYELTRRMENSVDRDQLASSEVS